jgi:integrase
MVARIGDDLVGQSVSVSTKKIYAKEWQRWSVFAHHRGLTSLPPRVQDLERYVCIELIQSSVARLDSFKAAILLECAKVNVTAPFKEPRLVRVMKGLRSRLRKAPVPRKPFKRSHIRWFIDLARGTDEAAYLRAAVALILCFHPFLRASEAFGIRLQDILVSQTGISVRILQAKNHRDGFLFVMPVSNDEYCAGRFLQDYLSRIRFVQGKRGFLCSRIRMDKFSLQEAVSFGTLHTGCQELIRAAGLDTTVYSTHSAKRGAATAAIKAGCNGAETTYMGRWKSDQSALQYMAESKSLRQSLLDRIKT